MQQRGRGVQVRVDELPETLARVCSVDICVYVCVRVFVCVLAEGRVVCVCVYISSPSGASRDRFISRPFVGARQ